MQAFLNDPAVRKKYLGRVRAHAKADEFMKGRYWEAGKGCAVGCTIHGDNHSLYETEIGIPEWLARLEDVLFENLPNAKAKKWPVSFLEAVNTGADLNKIRAPFCIYLMNENLRTLDDLKVDADKFPDVAKAIDQTRTATLGVIAYH